MHSFWEFFLVALVAGWAFDSIVNARIDKRLRAAGIAPPAKPRPKPSVSWRESLAVVCAVAFLIGLFAVAGHFTLG
jgi:hypothetical protein